MFTTDVNENQPFFCISLLLNGALFVKTWTSMGEMTTMSQLTRTLTQDHSSLLILYTACANRPALNLHIITTRACLIASSVVYL